MSRRLFGTDGVRGRAGEFPLDVTTIRRLAAALVRVLGIDRPRLLLGRDTRESGPWIERELACGAETAGAEVTSAGIVPTPAIAFLTRALSFDAGVMISASHNPFEDNGIKIFSGRGAKYGEATEREIEQVVADPGWQVSDREAAAVVAADCVPAYLDHASQSLPAPERLRGLRVGVDCANGAMAAHAPRLFERLGLRVTALATAPDGRNINLNCGSTHPEALAAEVTASGLRLGVAFDGDGDRAVFVDHRGRLVDGDAVLLMCAGHMKAHGRLRGNAVVATVMSNLGLELGLRERGIELVRCAVGDKYVMQELVDRQLALGGEQSGHIIFSDQLYTGDGLITALNVLRVMADGGRELADLADEFRRVPQVLVNVRVRDRVEPGTFPEVASAIGRAEAALGAEGRVLVRCSGTEPLVRIMIEGRDEREIRRWAAEIAGAVAKHLSPKAGAGARTGSPVRRAGIAPAGHRRGDP